MQHSEERKEARSAPPRLQVVGVKVRPGARAGVQPCRASVQSCNAGVQPCASGDNS